MQQLAARSKRNIHVATDAIHGIHSLSANSYTTNRICILPSYHLAVLPSCRRFLLGMNTVTLGL
jgi:hypothetical protein